MKKGNTQSLILLIVLTIVAPLTRAVEIEPNNSEIRCELGYALAVRKKYKKAIAELQTAAKLQPQNPPAEFVLGQIYLLSGDRAAAQRQYRKVASLDSSLAKRLYDVMYGGLIVTVGK